MEKNLKRGERLSKSIGARGRRKVAKSIKENKLYVLGFCSALKIDRSKLKKEIDKINTNPVITKYNAPDLNEKTPNANIRASNKDTIIRVNIAHFVTHLISMSLEKLSFVSGINLTTEDESHPMQKEEISVARESVIV